MEERRYPLRCLFEAWTCVLPPADCRSGERWVKPRVEEGCLCVGGEISVSEGRRRHLLLFSARTCIAFVYRAVDWFIHGVLGKQMPCEMGCRR